MCVFLFGWISFKIKYSGSSTVIDSVSDPKLERVCCAWNSPDLCVDGEKTILF